MCRSGFPSVTGLWLRSPGLSTGKGVRVRCLQPWRTRDRCALPFEPAKGQAYLACLGEHGTTQDGHPAPGPTRVRRDSAWPTPGKHKGAGRRVGAEGGEGGATAVGENGGGGVLELAVGPRVAGPLRTHVEPLAIAGSRQLRARDPPVAPPCPGFAGVLRGLWAAQPDSRSLHQCFLTGPFQNRNVSSGCWESVASGRRHTGAGRSRLQTRSTSPSRVRSRFRRPNSCTGSAPSRCTR